MKHSTIPCWLTTEADWGMEPTRPRRRRLKKPTLAGALKQASRAGVTVAGATLTSDGVVLTFGNNSAPTQSANPWDEVLQHARH